MRSHIWQYEDAHTHTHTNTQTHTHTLDTYIVAAPGHAAK